MAHSLGPEFLNCRFAGSQKWILVMAHFLSCIFARSRKWLSRSPNSQLYICEDPDMNNDTFSKVNLVRILDAAHYTWNASWMRLYVCYVFCVVFAIWNIRFPSPVLQVASRYANTRHKHVTHIPFGGLSGFAALGTPWDLLEAFRVLTFMGNEYRQYLGPSPSRINRPPHKNRLPPMP